MSRKAPQEKCDNILKPPPPPAPPEEVGSFAEKMASRLLGAAIAPVSLSDRQRRILECAASRPFTDYLVLARSEEPKTWAPGSSFSNKCVRRAARMMVMAGIEMYAQLEHEI